MVLSVEILEKYVGQKVKDIYGREAGYIVNLYVEVDGTVTGIEIENNGSFMTIDPSRIKVENDSISILPDWKAEAISLLTKADRIRKRQRALEELYNRQEIPKNLYDETKRKLDAEMLKVKEEQLKIKNKLKARLNDIDEQLVEIDKAMVSLKMSYISGDIPDFAYKSSIEILKQGKESYTAEMDDIKKTIDKLDSLDKEGLDIGKPSLQINSSQDQGVKGNEGNKSELPMPIPVKVINTL